MKFSQIALCALLVISCISFSSAFSGGDTLRVATYNCLNYPGDDAAIRDPYFRTVFAAMDPDILVTQEMQSQAGLDSIQFSCLNYYVPAEYSAVAYHEGEDTNNGFFYKPSKVQFLYANYITTNLRDIGEFVVKVLSSGETVHVLSTHFKAGETSEDSLERSLEANTLRQYLNGFAAGTKFIFVGDLNLYTSAEAAYTTMLDVGGGSTGRLKSAEYAGGMAQQCNVRAYTYTVSANAHIRRRRRGGIGLSFRFHPYCIRFSRSEYGAGYYWAYGNDGYHFNDSINQMPNHAVPESVANGLAYASNHFLYM